jgi:two-component system chemotaxis response regulator CheB
VADNIGVLIVEDSLVTRRFLAEIINSEPDLHVVGEACDGEEALRLVRSLRPDVVSMDVSMPSMDGLEATRRIMAENPTPIVVVSATLKKSDVDLAFEALQAGALAAVEKPPGSAHVEFEAKRDEMITTLRLMARVKVVRRRAAGSVRPTDAASQPVAVVQPEAVTAPETAAPAPITITEAQARVDIVAVGASAGGPAALAKLLSGLPENLPVPVAIVQHLAADFLPGLARWLEGTTPLTVRLAREGELLHAGVVYLAPGNVHMTINGRKRVHLLHTRGGHRHQPSATVLLESVAEHYGEAAIGVILTGMGDDGAAGLLAMREAGACTLAQDEKSCVVFGMPAAAIECGAAEYVVPLDRMAATILEML